MKRWQLWQMNVGFGAVFLLLVLNAIAAYQDVLGHVAAERQVSQSHQMLLTLEQTLSTLKDAETGQRGYLLTGNEDYLEPYYTAIAELNQRLEQLQQLGQSQSSDPRQLSALTATIAAKRAELADTIALRRTQGLAAALRVVESDRGKRWMDQIRQQIATLQAQETQQLQQTQQNTTRTFDHALLTLNLVTGASFVVIGSLTALYHRNEGQRRQIETQLRESQQQYQSLVAAAPVGIFRTDAAGQAVYVNEGWHRISGLSLAQAQGAGWRQALHPDDRDRVATEWYAAVQANRPFQLEYRFQSVTGQTHWVYGQAVAERDATGQITGYVGTITDISDRKAVELQLQERENLLDLLIQFAPVSIIMCDREMRYLLITQQAVQQYQLESIPAVLGRSHYEVFPHLPDAWKQVHQRCLAGAVERREEDSFINANGVEQWLCWEVRPWYTATQEIGGIIIFSEDITARKQIETHLRHSEERLRRVLEEMPVMLDAFDENFHLIVWNQECERVTGFTAAEVIGQSVVMEQFYPDPLYRQQMMAAWAERGHNYRNWEWDITCKDGSVRTVSWSNLSDLFPVPGWASWGIGVDVTDRTQAQRTLQDLNTLLEQRVTDRTAQLEETNQELQAFTYSVSHDLRAPLRVMQGFAQALQEDYGDRLDEMAQTYLQSITNSAIQMDTLISDLLAYSRLTRAQMELRPTDLNQVVAQAYRQVQAQIATTGAELAIAPQLPTVIAHAPTLVQVVANLLSNALKFVIPGTPPQITIEFALQENQVCLSVRDNGIGIAPEHQQRIFRVFERLHGVETYPGTGIGLAIVEKGIERMRGRVGVASQLGAGSRFWLLLPLSGAAGISPPSPGAL